MGVSIFRVECQGSTLGPILFLLYINNLKFSLKYSSSSHFTDDTCLLYAQNKLKLLETNLNYDLKRLSEWREANYRSLNVKKTKLITFQAKHNKSRLDTISIKILHISQIS